MNNLLKLLNKNQLNVDNVSTFNLDQYVGLTASHPQSYHYYMDDMLFKQYPYFNRNNIYIEMEMPMIWYVKRQNIMTFLQETRST